MPDFKKKYLALSEFYEQCLNKYGPTPKGVDWPNQIDLTKRFNVILDVARDDENSNISLLDLGCGYGALVEYFSAYKPNKTISYTGIDVSEKMIQSAQNLYPNHHFFARDILTHPIESETFDYVVMNGLLTEKRELTWNEMITFAQNIIKEAFKICRKGIAFNVMSYHVDWCDPNLFYWSFDDLSAFLITNCSRHFNFRNEYGLYEFTTYVYKK